MTVLDERLPHWVRTVELGASSERFDALHAAAESVGGGLDPRAILDLVAYAMGRPSTPSFIVVRDAVLARDRSFAAAAGDLEPRLVACAALARAFESADVGSAVAAGAVLSAEFAGLSSPVEELPELARAAMARRFRGLRSRVEPPNVDFVHAFDEVVNFPVEHHGRDEQVRLLVGATASFAQRCATAFDTLGRRFETRLDAADEELDVLWWAFSKTSEDRGGMRFRDVNAGELLLRSGLELAELHRTDGEIPSAAEILGRVLGPLGEEAFTIADVAADAAEGVTLPAVTPSPLLPILTSCAECRAFRGAEQVSFEREQSWIDGAARYGVDPMIRRTGAAIAAQTLRELLLVRAATQ